MSTENGFGQAYGQFEKNVIAISPEQRIGLDFHFDQSGLYLAAAEAAKQFAIRGS